MTALAARSLGPILAVVESPGAAEELQRDCSLLLGERGARALPVEERSPYSATSSVVEVVGERLHTLVELVCGERPAVTVVCAAGLMQRTLDLPRLTGSIHVLNPGDDVGRDRLIATLVRCGFSRVPLVEDSATFAVRGSVVDAWYPGAGHPVRIDLFGDEVETLKWFDPVTQRTLGDCRTFAVGPVREVLFDSAAVACAGERLRRQADRCGFPDHKLQSLLRDIDNGIHVIGLEGLAPAFSTDPRPSLWQLLQDIVPSWPCLVHDPRAIHQAMEQQWQMLEDGWGECLERRGRLAFEPSQHCAHPQQIWDSLVAATRIRTEPRMGMSEEKRSGDESRIELVANDTDELKHAIERVARTMKAAEVPADLFRPVREKLESLRRTGVATLVLVHGEGGLRRMRSMFDDHRISHRTLEQLPDLLAPGVATSIFRPSVHAHLCPVALLPARGVELPAERLAVYTEEDFFGRRPRRQQGSKAPFRTSLSDLDEGDVVVHVDFGVGIYRGLTRLNLRGVEGDYLLIHYKNDDKLYLPVTRINLIQRYSGNEQHRPRLDRLGGQTWARTKSRVKRAILAMAQDLLALYARREVSHGQPCPPPDAFYREFESRFPFEETRDQSRAIQDVVNDLLGDKPMDRLVCGDVGYGKTEVAMRAAMLGVLGGRQVAVLAPTTVLAQQHYLTFCQRFEGMPVEIDVASRMRKGLEVKRILERTRAGEVDILIGTHRLLSHDVGFKDLGLLIVDEEHRFGVKDKERIKALRANVHVLSLSATPIPRTLQMGFFGIRDLSIIDTPPADRRAIRTTVTHFEKRTIREAVERELARGGQVYFVHNRVHSIGGLADFMRRLVPHAKVGVAHGQMAEAQLEKVMLAFIRGETNVLVTTTIIESGIDIPTANTILINRADMLGLAQLYQLRGRVGRSHQRAYAYLLVPAARERLTPKARRRLEVIQRFVELGAGFKIAQHDLEIRGAGDLLGKSQHGHVAAVGYEMYAELLAEAVHELRGQDVSTAPEPELNVHVPAFLPDGFIPDVQERLSFYQRMATARSPEEVYEILSALQDRYGNVPDEARTLCEVMILKVKLKQICARAIDLVAPREDGTPARVVISLGDSSSLDAGMVAAWVAEQPERVRLTPQMKLYLTATTADWLAAGEETVELARRFLDEVRTRVGSERRAPDGGSSI